MCSLTSLVRLLVPGFLLLEASAATPILVSPSGGTNLSCRPFPHSALPRVGALAAWAHCVRDVCRFWRFTAINNYGWTVAIVVTDIQFYGYSGLACDGAHCIQVMVVL